MQINELVLEPNMPITALSKRVLEYIERYGHSAVLMNGRAVLKFGRAGVPEAEDQIDPKDNPPVEKQASTKAKLSDKAVAKSPENAKRSVETGAE